MKKMILILFFISFFSFSGESEMVAYMKKNNSRLSEKEAKDIYKNVVRYSTEYDFDPILVFSVMKTESNFRHSTVSTAGAKGLMQLMPENFEEFKVDNSIRGNIRGGIKHLKRDYDNTQDVTKTLVCYNAGCGRLQNNEWRKIRETRNYVKKINAVYPEIKNIYYVNVENPFASSILANGLAVIGSYKILDSIKNENHTENKEYLYWRESYI
ncbi:murein transglycosylase C [Sebaldella termitidis]|jgi:soluble lytic murein transglycosylase-like protein|uniref:Lytic transglycosylase catalytic n=1 Tax=Sebaldella termitidis (strain ATCC 33386 / NCTC 11300) TaxID=526218 RepID=D1APP6_SEBTE|nr:transglycosylase SLT domain-containing protein [Sebaldella termitidis]ACZ10080.1 Lytic transglycosylase catalytic [Sebaldella termitidis ATCC 33386]SUI25415.1 murein transglycosylase C [Sebaldella termitidis]